MPRRPSIRALLANERTFLAWLRTAIAVMAFGFVVDKFDLFVRLRLPRHVGPHSPLNGAGLGIGLGLTALIIVLGAGFRYWRIRNDVLAGATRTAESARTPLVAAALLVLAAIALILYLWATSQVR